MPKKAKPLYADPSKVLRCVASRAQELRKQKYSSYEKFAALKDISRSQIWRYENGGDLKLSSLIKLLNALNVPLSEFFNSEFEKMASEQNNEE
ncbi:helix-turn-helix domain-containing protein [Mucilaginibacter agri]|uniref:Helix-turn-helix domain-containing protein n=1 Tax=Mucilaginibacter agri TaxID=2695265 RepID=A0A965ZF64_9SPHI|nr:helix-turn-helix domain-containing protein [Mucilaginibacter agri]NCD69088.1 helix-turn-helix domain-containing protein [Mucilaginibacter agri]